MNVHLQEFENLFINEDNVKNKFPEFHAGDTIEVRTKTVEGGKTRIQTFQGIVIQRRHPGTTNETFTVRKLVEGVAVERIFPIYSPIIAEITIVKHGIVRRARLFYLRNPKFKRKIRNKFISNKNKEANKSNETISDKSEINKENISKDVTT